MNLGGGGCGEPRSHHSTPAWATRVKLHLQEKKRRLIFLIIVGWAISTNIPPGTTKISTKKKKNVVLLIALESSTMKNYHTKIQGKLRTQKGKPALKVEAVC